MARKLSREEKQRKWHREDESIKNFRAKAPHVKALLRDRGCNLPFYDYLDSYEDEFKRTVTAAMASHPSLLGVHEVDDDCYADTEHDWSKFGYNDLTQILFSIGNDVVDYGAKSLDANLSGSMSAFHDSNGNLRSVILMKQSIRTTCQHRDLKYAVKLAALNHEIGHVEDLERGINFNVSMSQVDIIEAEVFAHLYALNRLAKRSLVQSFNMLSDALRLAVSADGYLGEVATKVVNRLPVYDLTDWNSVLAKSPKA